MSITIPIYQTIKLARKVTQSKREIEIIFNWKLKLPGQTKPPLLNRRCNKWLLLNKKLSCQQGVNRQLETVS